MIVSDRSLPKPNNYAQDDCVNGSDIFAFSQNEHKRVVCLWFVPDCLNAVRRISLKPNIRPVPRGRITTPDKAEPMSQSLRLPEILAIARRDGRVSVEGLAAHFNVTLQTIRRDLTALAEQGKLERVHGGAVHPSTITNIGYEDRRGLNDAEKAAIAARCARDIPNGCSIFLNIGTTTEAVAHALMKHRDIMVLTNNMNVANILVDNASCDIILVGGLLRRSDGGLVGTVTTQAIGQFKFDLAVISCSALDLDGDMLDFDIQEVGVSQAILRQARQSFLVADQSKFQRRAPARIASLSQIDRFYTNAPPPAPVSEACRGWGTQVVLAGRA